VTADATEMEHDPREATLRRQAHVVSFRAGSLKAWEKTRY